jgi:alpha-mannosidase
MDYVEVEFSVGSVPIDDSLGKEIITRFTTGVASNLTVYTDSNGREMQQRIYNVRLSRRVPCCDSGVTACCVAS